MSGRLAGAGAGCSQDPGGAELLTHVVHSWVHDRPEHALLQLDLMHAYRRALRCSVLASTAELAPSVAHNMANEWAAPNTAWARVDGGPARPRFAAAGRAAQRCQ